MGQGLEIHTYSMLAGIMKIFSHLTACSLRAMSEQEQKQALIIRTLQECNMITQLARCPALGQIQLMARTVHFSEN